MRHYTRSLAAREERKNHSSEKEEGTWKRKTGIGTRFLDLRGLGSFPAGCFRACTCLQREGAAGAQGLHRQSAWRHEGKDHQVFRGHRREEDERQDQVRVFLRRLPDQEPQYVEAVAKGIADISTGPVSFVTGKFPELSIFEVYGAYKLDQHLEMEKAVEPS